MRNLNNSNENKDETISGAKTLTVCFLIYAILIQMLFLPLSVKGGVIADSLAPTQPIIPAVVTTHRPTLNSGIVNGSLRLQTGESFSISSGITMSEIFLPGTPSFTFNGGTNGGTVSDNGATTPTGYRMTMNGGTISGKIHKQADPVAFPSDIPATVPNQSGTRAVTINSAADVALIGNWATVADLTVNVANLTINVPPGNYRTITLNSNSLLRFSNGTYNFSNTITLNNGSRIESTGAVAINLRSLLTLNTGKFILGAGTLPSDVKLNILGTTANVNANCEINASVRIPNGTLTMNGSTAVLRGIVWTNNFTLNGGTVTGDTCATNGSGCPAVPSLTAVSPNRKLQGQTVQINLTGNNTSWASGQTRASFGGEISVGGAAEGALGAINVLSATTATADLVINPKAALAPRSVRVVTQLANGQTEDVSLTDAFTVLPVNAPGSSQNNVSTIAGSAGQIGFADGAGTVARFSDLAGIAVGADDAVYIADAGNNRIRVARQQTGGGWSVQTLAGNGTAGFADGAGTVAKFNSPQSIAIAADNSLYVADAGNHRIRRILPDGTVSTVAGDGTAGFVNGNGATARFNNPKGIAADNAGNIYIADTGNSAVRRIDFGGNVVTLAGDGTVGANDSPNARFNGLAGITIDGDSVYIYLADGTNHLIRRLDPTNSVMTIAGNTRGYADGSAQNARFANPTGLAIDGAGRLVIADTINSLIRSVTPNLAASGSVSAVSTIAGAGEYGAADGAGNLAKFKLPRGVAVSRSSAIYVADTGNNTLRRIGLPPQILSFNPAVGRIADTVTIYGENFDGRGNDKNTVTFAKTGGGTITASVTNATRTQLSVVVPATAATGRITVTTADGAATSATNFEVQNIPPPVITDFTPRRGQVGTAVKLLGTNLKTGNSNPIVTFKGTNNTRLNALVNSATIGEVNILVPNGAITGLIELTTPWGNTRTAQEFVVDETQQFQITVAPSTIQAVERTQGTGIVYLNSSNSTFTQLARLSAANLPGGVTATFEPAQITAGANSTLKLSLANSAIASGSYQFTVRAAAIIDGREVIKETTAGLSVLTAGQTTISGRVLNTDSEPIIGATVSLDGQSAATDASGTFTLAGVTAGPARPLQIDGRTASAPNRTYPVITEPANIVAGTANQISYTFYLPPIDTQYEVTVVPGQTTAVTNPKVEGLQMTIPPNANLRNRDGSPVTRVSITPLAIDRTPTPLPPGVKTGLVYTSQPSGALSDVPIPVIYPNLLGAEPGSNVELYAFNHDTVQWYIYGYGQVSTDGRTIFPKIDPNTGNQYGLRDFSWHFPNVGRNGNPGGGNNDDCPKNIGSNPVDYSTGIKLEEETDLAFGGSRGGIVFTRTYSSDLANTNCQTCTLGGGWSHNYSIRLNGNWSVGGAGSIIRPTESVGRLFNYSRTDANGSLVFTSTATVSQIADSVKKLTDGTFEYVYGNGTVMKFDAEGKLTAIRDRNGNVTTLTYSGGNLTQISDPVGRSVTLGYDLSNRVSSLTDPLNRTWQYGYTGNALTSIANPGGEIMTYTYSQNRLSAITDARGNFVKWVTYDANGRVIKQVFADGGTETYNYQLSGGIVTQTVITDPLGRKMTKRFNANGYVIEQMDALGQIARIDRNLTNNLSNSTSGSCGCTESLRQYDARGNATSLTNRLGERNQFEFEPKFNNITKITDKSGKIMIFSYDNNGNLISSTNSLNQTSSINYNQFGQVIITTDPLGHTTQTEYDNFGNVAASVNALGERATFEYDAIGRPTAAIDPLGRRNETSYDQSGRIKTTKDSSGAVTTFDYDLNGNLIKITNAAGKIWTNKYDGKNRLTEQKNSLGFINRTVYNKSDELVSTVSAENRTTSFTYTPRGQTETITDPLGNTVRMTYDYRNRLIALTDRRGNVTTFVYDELSRPVSMRDALGRKSSVRYDAAGNISEQIDRLGNRKTFIYDQLDRPLTETFADAQVNYNYDTDGRLMSIADTQGGSVSWTYDNADQVLTEQTAQGTISYSYNSAGQRSSMSAPGQQTVNYGYDTAGGLNSITQNGETFSYNYDTLSRLILMTRPNGVNTTYTYDDLNRLKRMTHGSIEDYHYAYTPDNKIANISSFNSTQLTPPAKTAGVANQSNQINQFGSAIYNFNDKGQTTSRTDTNGTTQYNWDSRGRLTTTTLPNGKIVNYSYDALGRRNTRSLNNQTTNFIYDGANVVQDKQGANQTNYLNGAGIDEKLKVSSAQTGNLYFLTDHLGSTQGLTGASGNVAEWQRYTPFGESDVTNSLTRYGFTGREKDADTNLIYYRARWYDAEQGRFISQDPIGLQGGSNLYSYVSNDPINKTDPSGLYEIDVHYYLTYYLASKHGCFSADEARTIGEQTQLTDELANTLPGKGDTEQQRYQNRKYHALHPGAMQGMGSSELWQEAMRDGGAYIGFGRYLHYLEDTFSHSGYTDDVVGHSPLNVPYGNGKYGDHETDKTATDPAKAQRMAASVWQALNQFSRLKKCGCEGTWKPEMWSEINAFINVKTDAPGRSTIDANWNDMGLANPGLGDPGALRLKRQYLGLRDRYTGAW